MSDRSILLGPGPRLDRVGVVLRALSEVPPDSPGSSPAQAPGVRDAQGAPDAAPEANGRAGRAGITRLTCLEDLLAPPPADPANPDAPVPLATTGRLILDADLLASEEIGFVHGFLKRAGRWALVLMGTDAEASGVRWLLGPRTTFVAWPPRLDELEGLLVPLPEPALVRSSPGPEAFDLHRLIEELLAESVLAGAPRYRFRSLGDLRLRAVRTGLRDSLAQLLWLSSACCDEHSVVELFADGREERHHDAVHLSLEFPSGPLAGLAGREALTRTTLERRLSPDAAARGTRAARALRRQGARFAARDAGPDRLHLDLLLPRRPDQA